MKSTHININLSEDLKRCFQTVCKYHGMSMSLILKRFMELFIKSLGPEIIQWAEEEGILDSDETVEGKNEDHRVIEDEPVTEVSPEFLESKNFSQALIYGEGDSIYDLAKTPKPDEDKKTGLSTQKQDKEIPQESELDSGFKNLKERRGNGKYYVDENDENIINIIFD